MSALKGRTVPTGRWISGEGRRPQPARPAPWCPSLRTRRGVEGDQHRRRRPTARDESSMAWPAGRNECSRASIQGSCGPLGGACGRQAVAGCEACRTTCSPRRERSSGALRIPSGPRGAISRDKLAHSFDRRAQEQVKAAAGLFLARHRPHVRMPTNQQDRPGPLAEN
jgi:hypothetical protein